MSMDEAIQAFIKLILCFVFTCIVVSAAAESDVDEGFFPSSEDMLRFAEPAWGFHETAQDDKTSWFYGHPIQIPTPSNWNTEKWPLKVNYGAGYNTNSGTVGLLLIDWRNVNFRKFPSADQIWPVLNPVSGYEYDGLVLPPAVYPGLSVVPFHPWPTLNEDSRTLRFRFVPGQKWNEFAGEFAQPSVFGTPFIGGAKAYWFERVYGPYTIHRLGGLAGLGAELTKPLSVNLFYRRESVRVFNTISTVPVVATSAGYHDLAMWSLFVDYNTFDQKVPPMSGYQVVAYGHLAGVPAGGDENFWQAGINIDYHESVGENTNSLRSDFRARAGVDFGGPAFGDDTVPFYQRFYAGGFGSVRGYSYRTISPKIAGEPVGGNFMILGGVEYGLFIEPAKVRPHIFSDFGTVTSTITGSAFDTIRGSVGVGVDFMLPNAVYPMQINYIFLHYNDQPGDILGSIAFALGVFF